MPRLSVGVTIGKNDEDIAAWYNMLKANGFSLSEWTGYLALAYSADRKIDIGTVNVNKGGGSVSVPSLLFGSGNSLSQAGAGEGRKRRGPNGEYVEGSVIMLSIYNQNAIHVYQYLREQGIGYSKAVKALIRRYLKYGDHTAAPAAPVSNDVGFLLDCIDRSGLGKAEAPEKQGRKEQGSKETSKTSVSSNKMPASPESAPKKNPLLDYI